MISPSIDFVRELNKFRNYLGLPKPIFKHHLSGAKFYTVIMIPVEQFGDLSAFGSGEGLNSRKDAKEEAALKAIEGLLEFHKMRFRDVNYDDLVSERNEKEVALEAVKNLVEEREGLRLDNFQVHDAYHSLRDRLPAIQDILDQNAKLHSKVMQLELDLKSGKADLK